MGGTSVNTAFTYVKNYTELSEKRKEEEKRIREMKKQEKIRKMNEEANKANMINFDEEEGEITDKE